ncbi:MAG TPA: hypothetical protein VGW31_09525 [Hanamia sp.]|nr:hypothetical protein [Hanamia sp.]
MTKITPEELVRYLYNETSEQKTALIKVALQTDWNLRVAFEKLLSAKQNLQETMFSPRQETINTILEYASKNQSQIHSL